MKFSPSHLLRYKQIAQLLWKYGRSDVVKQMGEDGISSEEGNTRRPGHGSPDELADDLEAMGPTFVKLGQMLSGRPDLLSEPYRQSLTRLQDKVKALSFEEVEEVVTRELDVRLSKAFSRFDARPLAAASLGQVHAAALRDGRPVVVKVQRPGLGEQILKDFEVLSEIAAFMDTHTDLGRRHHFLGLVEEFRISIRHELNYEREAQNMVALGQNLAEFRLIDVPQPVPDYCTRRVLTMDQVQGRKITEMGPLARLDIPGRALAEELFRAYLKQVLVDGLFHADPHAGNVFITDQAHVALLDLGMVGRTTPSMQENLFKFLLSLSEGNCDQAAEIVLRIGHVNGDFNLAEFRRKLAQVLTDRQGQGLEHLNVGRLILDVTCNATDHGVRLPSDLALLGKTLLQLDEIGRILDPDFEPNAAIRRSVNSLMLRRARHQATRANVLTPLLEFKEFVSHFPTRLNRVMDAISNSEMELKVKAVDARMILEGLHKIANRIASGVVLAALIVGASTLSLTETDFQILGYPGLAMLFFLAAAAGGFWMLVSIFIHDRDSHRRS